MIPRNLPNWITAFLIYKQAEVPLALEVNKAISKYSTFIFAEMFVALSAIAGLFVALVTGDTNVLHPWWMEGPVLVGIIFAKHKLAPLSSISRSQRSLLELRRRYFGLNIDDKSLSDIDLLAFDGFCEALKKKAA